MYFSVPTDPKGELDIVELEKVMRNERSPTTAVTFVACTDDLEALDYLNNWDHTMERVDVVDDYRSELAQIREKRGPNVKFTFGDYLVKALIGSIDPKYVYKRYIFYFSKNNFVFPY